MAIVTRPYSGASDKKLPDHVKKMPLSKRKQWVEVFNSAMSACKKKGGDMSKCEGSAFAQANGVVKKKQTVGETEPMNDRKLFTRIWEGFLDSIGLADDEADFDLVPRKKGVQKTRSMSMSRLREQLYTLLEDTDGRWAYPIDIFVDDDGKSLFSIVAQSGKLYQVPLTVSEEEVTLGDWIQVKQEYTPVEQSRFTVKRQKDGTYRWFSIAATSVLNRVGEIDSTKLFDSFIARADKDEKYPRLDMYHYGSSDPEKWEFGTADYLARDGVCYLASGTFDTDHPLARATIKAAEEGRLDDWGNSIEFFAIGKPQTILVDPEVKIPVYEDGENTRISLVLEEDAAGLFTRIGVNEEVTRAMDKTTKEALKKLFGDDEDGLKAFVDSTDSVNRTVKDENLIHRAKSTESDESEDATDETEDDSENESDEIVLDNAALEAITQQITQTDGFKAILQSLTEIKTSVAEMVVARENDRKEIDSLKKNQTKVTQTIEKLNKEDGEKKQEYLTDLPSRRQKTVTYRPSDVHNQDADDLDDDLEAIATRTLNGISHAY